jgi:hypothetical protein
MQELKSVKNTVEKELEKNSSSQNVNFTDESSKEILYLVA